MGKTLRALGLMSGTSMDGIDVALIETDGEDALTRGPCATFPYAPEFRAELSAAVEAAKVLRFYRDWVAAGEPVGALLPAHAQRSRRRAS